MGHYVKGYNPYSATDLEKIARYKELMSIGSSKAKPKISDNDDSHGASDLERLVRQGTFRPRLEPDHGDIRCGRCPTCLAKGPLFFQGPFGGLWGIWPPPPVRLEGFPETVGKVRPPCQRYTEEEAKYVVIADPFIRMRQGKRLEMATLVPNNLNSPSIFAYRCGG